MVPTRRSSLLSFSVGEVESSSSGGGPMSCIFTIPLAEDFTVRGDEQLPRTKIADIEHADDALSRQIDVAVEGRELEGGIFESSLHLVAAAQLDDVLQGYVEDFAVADEALPAGEVDDEP